MNNRFALKNINIYIKTVIYIYIYVNSTNVPPIMIINRIYENQNLLSLVSFLVGLRTYQHPCTWQEWQGQSVNGAKLVPEKWQTYWRKLLGTGCMIHIVTWLDLNGEVKMGFRKMIR